MGAHAVAVFGFSGFGPLSAFGPADFGLVLAGVDHAPSHIDIGSGRGCYRGTKSE